MSGRFARLVQQLSKYFGVALVGLIVDFGILTLVTSGLGAHYLVGSTSGFVCGLLVTYFLSERYVFSSPKITSPWIRFGAFALIGLVGLLILNLLMWGLTTGLGLFYLFSKVLATVVVYLFNFFSRRALYGAADPDAAGASTAR
ncbi:putative flippase GtrA [Glaciihabitans tibetensis]|uniref:Putative flippase GtrA n=1 Tax=Glaciihabitans tibetensis TaxID=1266600 RepID=A0A2T0VFC2_9MICO|nr:GtrA family protein [Glaciihabitans tibetensis]PRY68908.1 putative flippase GtrA [Glaciihabitans tibetensis]